MKKLIILLICGAAGFYFYKNSSKVSEMFTKKASDPLEVAKILHFEGTAKIINIVDGVAQGEENINQDTEIIKQGQGIETTNNGYVVLEFKDQSQIKISDGSRLVFNSSDDQENEIQLVKGAIVLEHMAQDPLRIRVGDRAVIPNGSAFFIFHSPSRDSFFLGKNGTFYIDDRRGSNKTGIGGGEFYVSYYRSDSYFISANVLKELPNWELKGDIHHSPTLYRTISSILDQERGKSPRHLEEMASQKKTKAQLIEDKLNLIRQEGSSLRARISEHTQERKVFLDDVSCINNKLKGCKLQKWKLLVENGWPTTETVSAASVNQQVAFLTKLAEKEAKNIEILTLEYNQVMREGKSLQEELIKIR
jgi:hypothetical protein